MSTHGVLPIIILFIIALILREVFCWYSKQNMIVALLEDIKMQLEKNNQAKKDVDTDH